MDTDILSSKSFNVEQKEKKKERSLWFLADDVK